jgi:hypothetical protein
MGDSNLGMEGLRVVSGVRGSWIKMDFFNMVPVS